MLLSLWKDCDGVILSAELVLLSTILVLGMIVGLVELQCTIVTELGDLSNAFGNLNQSYKVAGFTSSKGANQFKARTHGASYTDNADIGDEFCNEITLVCSDPGEQAK